MWMGVDKCAIDGGIGITKVPSPCIMDGGRSRIDNKPTSTQLISLLLYFVGDRHETTHLVYWMKDKELVTLLVKVRLLFACCIELGYFDVNEN